MGLRAQYGNSHDGAVTIHHEKELGQYGLTALFSLLSLCCYCYYYYYCCCCCFILIYSPTPEFWVARFLETAFFDRAPALASTDPFICDGSHK